MKNVTVLIKKLSHAEDLPLPQYTTKFASGMDLIAAVTESVKLKPFQRALIPTGISIELPPGYETQVRPRSGLALKHGITVLNTPGTIDADYRGEVGVILINLGQEDFVVERGMRIAQLVICPVCRAIFLKKKKLTETERGKNGFGSTGIK
ncbi:MAG: dUTP diphosphatase [Candidatus Anstonellaceae archaeon]